MGDPVTGRRSDGTFAPGTTGNPGGRPARAREVRELLAEAGPLAARRIIELIMHSDTRIALRASQDIVDRLCGKAKETVQLEGESGVTTAAAALLAMARQAGAIPGEGPAAALPSHPQHVQDSHSVAEDADAGARAEGQKQGNGGEGG